MAWIAATSDDAAQRDPRWLAAAVVVGFAVSFVGTGLAGLGRDAFVLLHVLLSGAFLVAYARSAGVTRADIMQNLPLGLIVGGLAAAFSVGFVLSGPPSPGLQGAARTLHLLWLGLVYGLVDVAILTIMPVYAAYRIARSRGLMRRWPGRILTGVLALLASLAVTAAYHLGFAEFRGPELLQPLIGNLVFTLAYILSASPIAPAIAHIALHWAAVIYSYESSVPLPPHY